MKTGLVRTCQYFEKYHYKTSIKKSALLWQWRHSLSIIKILMVPLISNFTLAITQSMLLYTFHMNLASSFPERTSSFFELTSRLESIMLQNLLIMLFGISPIYCLLCLFLCLLAIHYADNLYL